MTAGKQTLFPVTELREYAEALDKDRGHDKSRVTELMREAATRLEDATSALRYIEQRYGRLDGVGWERVLDA